MTNYTGTRAVNETLPISFPPNEFENIPGFIIRLSQENLYERPRWIYTLLTSMDPRMSFSYFQKCSLGLSRLIGGHEEDIKKITYKDAGVGNHESILLPGGHRVSVTHFNLEKSRVCPLCLKESGAVQWIWDLQCYLACPKHEVLLVNRCPSCHAKINWRRPRIDTCAKCKQSFSVGPYTTPPTCLRDLSSLLASKVPNLIHIDHSESIMTVWEEVSLSDILAVIKLLITTLTDDGESLREITSDRFHTIMLVVATCITEWPNGYHQYLTKLFARDAGNGHDFSTSRKSVFGWFYARIAYEHGHEKFAPLKEELLNFIYNTDYCAYVTKRGHNGLYDSQKMAENYLTKEEVIDQLSIGSDKFDELFTKGLIEGRIIQMGKQKIYRVKASSLSRVQHM